MAVTTTNLGVITAYGDAVAAGYTGTKAEWQALMASYATVGQQAVDAKNAAVAAKDTAVSKATEATTAANTATTKANEASASAQSIAQSASQIQENTDDIEQLKSELYTVTNGYLPIQLHIKSLCYIDKDGSEKPSASWKATDFIPCDGYSKIVVNSTVKSNGYNAFYKSDKTPVANPSFVTNVGETTVTVPSNAAYFRLSNTGAGMASTTVLSIIGSDVECLKNDVTTLQNNVGNSISDSLTIPQDNDYVSQNYAFAFKQGRTYEITFFASSGYMRAYTRLNGSSVDYINNGNILPNTHVTFSPSVDADGLRILMYASGSFDCYELDTIVAKINDVTNMSNDLANVFAAKKHYDHNNINDTSYTKNACFVHITDTHGDFATHLKAVEITKKINALGLLNSGDTVATNSTDPLPWQAVPDCPYFIAIGNHDEWNASMTEEAAYAKYIAPFAENNGYTFPTGLQYPTYYYKDFTSNNIRLIVVNQYQYAPEDEVADRKVHYTQEQINWLIQTLLATPANYGVILMSHIPESAPTAPAPYNKFRQENTPAISIADIKPLKAIIDAFISGTTINQQFSNAYGTPSTFDVIGDFSGKNSGVEFICHVCGHEHIDLIGYHTSATNKQLVLDEICTSSNDGRNKYNDTARIPNTPTEHAFNVYYIDRAAKTVKVVRYGAHLACDFSADRDYMIIPYAD